MMKKNIIVIFSLIIFIASTVYISAIEVGVYIQQDNKDPYTVCVDASAGNDAYKVLSKVDNLRFESMENSHIICQSGSDLSFICSDANKKSVRVIMLENGAWGDNSVPSLDAGSECYNPDTFNMLTQFRYYSFTTHQFKNIHYCAKHGDVLGVFTEEIPTNQPPPPDAQFTPTFNEICEPLRVKNAKTYIDGLNAKNLNEKRDTIDDMAPGGSIELRFGVNNNADKNLGEDINDITVTGTLKNIDYGDDIVHELDSFDLSPQDDKNVILKFDIPEYAKEGSYDLYVNIEGEDDNRHIYKYEAKYGINVVKLSPGLTLELSDNPKKALCRGVQNTIPLKIKNSGLNDETAIINLLIDSMGISTSDTVSVPKGTMTNPNNVDRNINVNIPDYNQNFVEILYYAEYSDRRTREYTDILYLSDCVPESSTQTNNAVNIGTSNTDHVAGISSTNIPPVTSNVIYQNRNNFNNIGLVDVTIIVLVFIIIMTLLIVLISVINKKSKR